jgi:hypothetical protein
MVAVDDEVRVSELVGDDRRKVPVREGPFHSLEPLADVGSTGTELTVEVAPPAVRPDDLAEGDGTKSDVAARERAQSPRGLFQRKKLTGRPLPADDAGEARVDASATAGIECRRHLLPTSSVAVPL